MQLMQVCARLAAESIAKLGPLQSDQPFPVDIIEWVVDAVCKCNTNATTKYSFFKIKIRSKKEQGCCGGCYHST